MGKWNLGQSIAVASQPMMIVREQIQKDKQLKSRVSKAIEQQKEQQKQNKGRNRNKGKKTASGKNNKAGLAAIEKIKGLDVSRENLLLLEKLQKQLVEKAETSEDLEDSVAQGNATAKQLRRIQHREIEGVEEEESQGVEDALQQILALAAERKEGEDGDWLTDNEDSDEDEHVEDTNKVNSRLVEKRLKDIVRENKNNEKIKREKKEYL